MSSSANPGEGRSYAPANVLGPLGNRQTYRNILYLCLAFPLGLVYHVVLMLCVALGIGLSVLLVGLLILLAIVVGIRYVASFERGLANGLLGTEIASPDDVDREADGVVESAKAYVNASSTWRGLGFVVLKFPLGVISFVLLVTFLGTAIEFLVLPLYPDGVLNIQVSGWRVAHAFETPTQRNLAVPVGAVLGVVAVHVLNAFARANASIAASLLGEDSDTVD